MPTMAMLLLTLSLMTPANANTMSDSIKAAQGEPSNFERLIAEISDLSNTPEYFIYQDELGAAMAPVAKTNSSVSLKLKQQSEIALSKRCPAATPDITAKMFEAKFKIATRLANVFSHERNIRHAKILGEFVGEVHANMIPDYKRLPAPANVMPPIRGGEPMVAGMDPKAIKDPKARAAYEAAIEESKLNGQKNNLQLTVLPHLRKFSVMMLAGYCNQLFASQPQEKQHLKELVSSAHLTEKEQKELAGE